MNVKKIGHCCLLINIEKATILTDPGRFSTDQNEITGIDAILITHEHGDHLHVDSLKEVLKNNPEAKVITNSGVAKKLDEAGIPYSLCESRGQTKVNNVLIEALDCKHEEIFEEIGQVQNTGYFIANKLFYPGDSFFDPERPVYVLALPVAGPWCKISDAVRYALRVKPQKAFPVHDGMLQKDKLGSAHHIPEVVFSKNGIEFYAMKEGDEKEF